MEQGIELVMELEMEQGIELVMELEMKLGIYMGICQEWNKKWN